MVGAAAAVLKVIESLKVGKMIISFSCLSGREAYRVHYSINIMDGCRLANGK